MSDGRVEKYLTLRQTFFPVGSSVCEENNEQQSRTLRAPRRRFISTDSQKNKLRHQIFFFLLYIASIFPLPTYSFIKIRDGIVRGSLSLSVFPPSPWFSTGRRLVAPAQPERSKPPGFLFPFPGEVRATSFYSARHRAF